MGAFAPAIASGPELVAIGPVGWAVLGALVLGGVVVTAVAVHQASDSADEAFPDKAPSPVAPCPESAAAPAAEPAESDKKPSPVGWPGDDPAQPPSEDWQWKGKGPPGSKQGNWVGPNGESLHPDLEHPEPIGKHWDYKDPDGNWSRIYPDGTMSPKD